MSLLVLLLETGILHYLQVRYDASGDPEVCDVAETHPRRTI